ncbi:MAG: FecR domain-containing protein [Sphingobacterium sp.]|jgi:ferric-dicitrate binding protein FerR (iron transport regulator)|nr:FecR domain-containing protein [Sphingobacterium sp.]
MEKVSYYTVLIRKYLRDELSEVEKEDLKEWTDADPAREQYLSKLKEGNLLQQELKQYKDLWNANVGIARQKRIKERLMRRIPRPERTTHTIRRWLPYVAAVLAIAIGTWLGVRLLSPSDSATIIAADTILPPQHGATLTLADGSVMALNADKEGIIISQNQIMYSDSSSQVADLGHDNDSSPIQMLTLTTPFGTTYQARLPDGSQVWLNGGSKIHYPSRFVGNDRLVELEGEAFFAVTKAVIPSSEGKGGTRRSFIVKTDKQTVKVLGTKFNISAYKDETATKTTLLEGAVRVEPTKSKNKAVDLSPGQQFTTDGSSGQLKDVDIEQYTSWKDGYFMLEGSLQDVLTQVCRWYNVELVFEGEFKQSLSLVTFPRDRSLGDLLAAIQRADSSIKYRINKQDTKSLKGMKRPERRLTIFR